MRARRGYGTPPLIWHVPITLLPVPSEIEVYKSNGLAGLVDWHVVHSGFRDSATNGLRGSSSKCFPSPLLVSVAFCRWRFSKVAFDTLCPFAMCCTSRTRCATGASKLIP